MEYINHTLDIHIEEATVITFGKFDGLHRGHELLMEEMKSLARSRKLRTVVFTFDIPPRKQVDGSEAKVLTTNEEKRLIFEECGVDYLIECPFTPEVMHMQPEYFLDWIVKSLHVKAIVTGTDFRFGYRRGGDYQLILDCQEKLGYEAHIMEKIREDERDISSTFVREEIAAGHLEKANHLLGYDYFIKSKVVHGKALGRRIGIPTINMILPPEKLLPPRGVYVTRVDLDGRRYRAVSNVGNKPTVGAGNPMGVETHILDYEGDLYGEVITVSFLHFLRPEQRFADVEALQKQMEADIRTAAAWIESNEPSDAAGIVF